MDLLTHLELYTEKLNSFLFRKVCKWINMAFLKDRNTRTISVLNFIGRFDTFGHTPSHSLKFVLMIPFHKT
jgi:hypothetical protein